MPYADLLSGRPVTAVMPLRFATAHRFLAAREILVLPSAVKRPCLPVSALPGCFFAAPGDIWELTVVFARATATFAESSHSPKPSLLFGNWSITSDSNASILFNRFRAFFAFIRSGTTTANDRTK
jgi:hypothetical protein